MEGQQQSVDDDNNEESARQIFCLHIGIAVDIQSCIKKSNLRWVKTPTRFYFHTIYIYIYIYSYIYYFDILLYKHIKAESSNIVAEQRKVHGVYESKWVSNMYSWESTSESVQSPFDCNDLVTFKIVNGSCQSIAKRIYMHMYVCSYKQTQFYLSIYIICEYIYVCAHVYLMILKSGKREAILKRIINTYLHILSYIFTMYLQMFVCKRLLC